MAAHTYWRASYVARPQSVHGLRMTLRPCAVLILSFLVGLAGKASAELPAEKTDVPNAEKKERLVEQKVEGTVTAYTSRTLSLETTRSDSGAHIEELLLPVDPKVTKFERITKIHDLVRGDRVRVQYRQKFQRTDDGEWKATAVTTAKITFLSHALGGSGLRGATDGGGS